MRRLLIGMGLASLLAACGGPQAGVYEIPLGEAYKRLENADMDGFRKARQCGILVHFQPSRKQDESITWRVTSSGTEVLRFTVNLLAEGEGTRATIDVPAAPGGGEMYDGKQQYPRPAFNQPIRPAIQELIDAAMEQRPYDVMRIPEPRNTDKVCSIQRAGLEHGSARFSVDDKPGMDSRQSARAAVMEGAGEGSNDSYGAPMDDAAGGNW